MTKPIIKEHNATTNKVTEREMTDDEFAQYTANQLTKATARAEQVASAAEAATAKAALLAKLGITAEEAALLLS